MSTNETNNNTNDLLTENEAFKLLRRIEVELGWTLLVMTRADAAIVWHGNGNATGEETITDEQWEAVRNSHCWRKMGEILLTAGYPWELLLDAVAAAKETLGELDD